VVGSGLNTVRCGRVNMVHYCLHLKKGFIKLRKLLLSIWSPLWSSGQSSWLQIQRSGFDSQHYQIFWEVVGLEQGPLSLVTTIEELFERKSSSSSLEIWEYSCRVHHADHVAPYIRKTLTLTSPISSGRSISIVHSQTKATELSVIIITVNLNINFKSNMSPGCSFDNMSWYQM
jgi:hypothetical protein